MQEVSLGLVNVRFGFRTDIAALKIISGILPKADIDQHVSRHGIAAERNHCEQRQGKRKR
jgi:hypothetical protein